MGATYFKYVFGPISATVRDFSKTGLAEHVLESAFPQTSYALLHSSLEGSGGYLA